jgi:xanthine dehydrogenase accessory factor
MILTVSNAPANLVNSLPNNSYYIVMTHNHQIDFEICEAIINRGSFSYLGLIGSNTKWSRFKHRLLEKGYPEEKVRQIHCPMGMLSIAGKRPMEIAVSIAGEIINLYHQDDPPRETSQGIPWKDLRQLEQQLE